MKPKSRLLFLSILLVFIGCSRGKTEKAVEVSGVNLVRSAKVWGGLVADEYKLQNGLKIILIKDKGTPVYAFQVWINAGSRDEKIGKTGLAHLFEHLMFMETSNMTKGEFDKTITSLGGDTNAGTWVDWTYYREELPAGTLEAIVKMEADRMVNLQLTEEQLKSEREVVLNERRFRVDNDPEGKMSVALYKEAFTKHPYGWPTLGWVQDINSFTISDLKSFYKTFYSPNNATVVIVGDINPKEALVLLEKYYAPIPPADLPEKKFPVEPPQDKEKRVTLTEPVESEKLSIGWHSPAVDDPDIAAIIVLNQILFDGKSSRLFQVLVEQLQISTEISGFVPTWNNPGLYEVVVTQRGNHTTAEAEKVIYNELERLQREGVSPREVQKGINQYEFKYYQDVSTSAGKAEAIGYYQTTVGDFTFSQELLKRIQNVTKNDVQHVARKYLTPTNRTVATVKRKS